MSKVNQPVTSVEITQKDLEAAFFKWHSNTVSGSVLIVGPDQGVPMGAFIEVAARYVFDILQGRE